MPSVDGTCPDCGGALTIAFGSRCVDGQLTWSASHRCADCDHALEADEWDSIPDDYRELELKLDGIWAIRLPECDYSLTTVLRILREQWDMSLSEIAQIKAELPGPILNGTRGEMDTIAYHLAEAGITVDVVARN